MPPRKSQSVVVGKRKRTNNSAVSKLVDGIVQLEKPLRQMVSRKTREWFDGEIDPVVAGMVSNEHIVLSLVRGAINSLMGKPDYRVTMDTRIPNYKTPQALLTALGCPTREADDKDEEEEEEEEEENEDETIAALRELHDAQTRATTP